MNALFKIKHKDDSEDVVRIISECYITTLEKNKSVLTELKQIFDNYNLNNYNPMSQKEDMVYHKALELVKLLPSKEIWLYVERINEETINKKFSTKNCFYAKREWLTYYKLENE